MLATQGRIPRDQARWAFEVKWDGMRVLARMPGDGGLDLRSRGGRDATARYPELSVLPGLLPGVDAILDGEAVALDSRGRPSFSRLQERMPLSDPSAIRAAARAFPVSLMLFDVLWLAGEDVTGLPYTARRALLERLGLDSGPVSVPPAWHGDGETALAWTREMDLEGVLAKRLDSRYVPGARSRDWIKIKHQLTVDVTIGGWVPARPREESLKSLLVGVPEGVGLRYCGSVGTGFSMAERRRLAAVLAGLETEAAPFIDAGRAADRPDPVRWARPVLTGEVEFRAWTNAGLLREPVWRGLRGDAAERAPF